MIKSATIICSCPYCNKETSFIVPTKDGSIICEFCGKISIQKGSIYIDNDLCLEKQEEDNHNYV